MKYIGDEKNWERIRNAPAGDPTVYVNMDAITQLPDEFQAIVAVVEFNRDKDFTNVGSEKRPSWYPGTRIMYDIAEKRGISSDGELIAEPIMEEVNINLMECLPEPCIIRKKVGYQVVKSGSVVQEDGTFRTVSRVCVENAWDEAVSLWNKEEEATEGYTKNMVDQYGKKGFNMFWNNSPSWHECRYDTKWKRRTHFDDLLDKALGKAETKSKEKVIRELAGLKTGYTTEDLKDGRFYFVKIVRSAMVLKLETAARVDSIRNGAKPAEDALTMVFGARKLAAPSSTTSSGLEPIIARVEPESEPTDPPPDETPAAAMMRKLQHYKDNAIVPAESVDTCKNLLIWLGKNKNPVADPTYWPKAQSVLKAIEDAIPEDMRLR